MSAQGSPLPFTGERFTPECVREIWYEHWHRYAFARPLAKGKRVLDAACGEGYGSRLLADVAAEVVGIDVDAASIEHARARYEGASNLRFEVMDATRLSFPHNAFDMVVSFETLEHLLEQEQLIAGFSRALADDGMLVISSPDKRTYSELAGFHNEFHVRELYREELLDLLSPHFSDIRLYGQKLLFQSVLWNLGASDSGAENVATTFADGRLVEGLAYAPIYYIALCSKTALPKGLPAVSLFGDREESVYTHYNQEIRKNMNAGKRIAELEAEIERLREQGNAARSGDERGFWRWWRHGRNAK